MITIIKMTVLSIIALLFIAVGIRLTTMNLRFKGGWRRKIRAIVAIIVSEEYILSYNKNDYDITSSILVDVASEETTTLIYGTKILLEHVLEEYEAIKATQDIIDGKTM